MSTGNIPHCLQAKQWGSRNIPPTNVKKNPQRRYTLCAKQKKRDEITWECKKCLVALNIPDCFEIYHTSLLFSSDASWKISVAFCHMHL
ncbi:piggyBac transposable element-derived protein 4-like [Vespula squamosa]|uniref:PiggyBac transposable element-derived protein 4-like n=1 Tax=Vespula squamosa TaxID=30214 RepID=A0ABD2BD52_VESSQ